jgi:hypothetical protein
MTNDKVRPIDSEFEGDPFEGYNKDSDNKVGVSEAVVIDLFRREDESWFVRVALKSKIRNVTSRSEDNFDRYVSHHDFLQAIGLMAAALVETRNEQGDMFDLREIVSEAITYA